jgi:hypothetical protein
MITPNIVLETDRSLGELLEADCDFSKGIYSGDVVHKINTIDRDLEYCKEDTMNNDIGGAEINNWATKRVSLLVEFNFFF